MAHGILKNCKVSGIACAVPPFIKKADDYNDIIGKDAVAKFIDTVGMSQGHVCDGRIMTSDLCFAAAEKLIAEITIDKNSIDALILVTQTPDYIAPSTACVLQYRLGLQQECMAYDINLACSGYVYGLVTAMSYLQTGGIKKVLLLAGDVVSYHCAPVDRGLMILSCDAGSATLIEFDENAPDTFFMLGTIGSGYKSLIVPYGGYKHRFGNQQRTEREPGVIRSDYDGYMDGAEVFKFSIMEVPKLFKKFFELFHYTEESFDMVFLHQANLFIMKNIIKRLKIPHYKMAISIDRFGNTGAATIPLTICDYYNNDGKAVAHRKQHVALSGYGIGLSLGVMSLTIDPAVCLPIFQTDQTFDDEIDNLHDNITSFVNTK